MTSPDLEWHGLLKMRVRRTNLNFTIRMRVSCGANANYSSHAPVTERVQESTEMELKNNEFVQFTTTFR